MNIADTPEHWPVAASAERLRTRLISVRTDQVRTPENQLAVRDVVLHPGAVAVLALDDADRVLMIRQYRHPVASLLWEIPAGLRDVAGEELRVTASRELMEEAGYRAKDWRVLADYYSSPGYSTERLRIFLARDLEPIPRRRTPFRPRSRRGPYPHPLGAAGRGGGQGFRRGAAQRACRPGPHGRVYCQVAGVFGAPSGRCPRRAMALRAAGRTTMKVGIPKEVKNNEYRVAITPAGVHELARGGHQVVIEAGAGEGSSIPDDDFAAAGAKILPTADDVWAEGELILKVKEPVEEEYHRMRSGQVLFTYLHLAASKACTDALLAAGVTSIAYETVQLPDGSLPLLAPMSEVAGRMAPQVGAHHLQRDGGGRGVLMGGVSGVYAAKVVVLGAGVSGMNAAAIALGMQAEVLLVDKNIARLRQADAIYQGHLPDGGVQRV